MTRDTLLPIVVAALFIAPLAANSQGADTATKTATRPDAESAAEARARLARRGAGLIAGHWDLRGIEPPSGVEVSTLPLLGGWLRKGLDARVALENGIGVWRRVQTTPPSGGIGGTPGEEVQSWVVAQTTAIRFFPFTDAGTSRVEPWLLGGGGFTMGIDDRETNGGGVLGGSAGGDGVAFVPAISLQGGAGVEVMLGTTFGLTGGARYQWTRFFQDFGGERTYQGPSFDVGVTYKFRFK